jgi:hypothetical protein
LVSIEFIFDEYAADGFGCECGEHERRDNAGTSGETPIGVDISERHILAATAYGEDESKLVWGDELKYVRPKYRSLRDSLSEAGALRARNRVGDKDRWSQLGGDRRRSTRKRA